MISIATNNLKKVRLDKGLTLAEVASKLGMAPSTLSQYELNKREPKLKTWEALANFYNVSVEYLMGLNEASSVPSPEKEALEFVSKAIFPPSDFEKAADLDREMKKISDLDFLQSLTPDQFAFELLFIAFYQGIRNEDDLIRTLHRLNSERHLLTENEKRQFTASFVEWYAKNIASYQDKSSVFTRRE